MNSNLRTFFHGLFNPFLLTTYFAIIFLISPFGDVIDIVYDKAIVHTSIIIIILVSTLFTSLLLSAEMVLPEEGSWSFLHKNKKIIALYAALIPYMFFYFYTKRMVLANILSDYFLGLIIITLSAIFVSRFRNISLRGLACGVLCGGIAILSIFLLRRFIVIFIVTIILAGIIGEIEKRECQATVYCNSFIIGLTAMALFLGIMNI